MNNDHLSQYAEEHPRRDVAVVGLRDQDGNVLLMRSHKLPDHWQPVGGGIDPEDTSPRMAAERELNEELGITIDPTTLKEVLQTPYDFGEGTVYFFDVKIDRAHLLFDIDDDEVVEYRWFSINELTAVNAMPATQKYLQKISE